MRVYGLQSHTIASLPVPVISALPKPANGYRRRRLILGVSLAVASALIITGTALSVRFIAGEQPNKALVTDVGTPAPRLSLVVLPFANLTNDSGQQYWAGGITEDLTTDLSQIPSMLVISRGSAFSYKDKHIDLRQIGRELRVRYVLEGSIQRAGNQLRINAQLIDAETDQHLWADRFDRELANVFVLQNEITSRIANALRLEVTKAEVVRPIQSPDAFDYYLRARAASARPKTREIHASAIELYEHALTLDPDSTIIKSDLASELAGRVLNNLTDSKEADLNRAERLAEEAIAASPSRAEPHFARGQVLRAQGNFAGAIPEYEAVLAVNRNSAYAYSNLGYCKLFTGLIEEVDPAFRAIHPAEPTRSAHWFRLRTHRNCAST